jgi:hypothetical protein
MKENKQSDGIFENILFLKMKSSKLINYWENMCESGQGTTMVEDIRTKGTMVIDLRANFMNIRWPPNTLRKFLPSALCIQIPSSTPKNLFSPLFQEPH